jgi:hypothetical protein
MNRRQTTETNSPAAKLLAKMNEYQFPTTFKGVMEKIRLFSIDNAARVWRDERLYRGNVHG